MTSTSGVITMSPAVLSSPRRAPTQSSSTGQSPSKPTVTLLANTTGSFQTSSTAVPTIDLTASANGNAANDPEEVRKLREIIRRLEQQNQILLSKSPLSPGVTPQSPNGVANASFNSASSNNSVSLISTTSPDRGGESRKTVTLVDPETTQSSGNSSLTPGLSLHRTPGAQTPRQTGKSRGTSRAQSRSISPSRLQEALRGRGASVTRSSRSSDDEDFIDELDELRLDADENDDSWLVQPSTTTKTAALKPAIRVATVTEPSPADSASVLDTTAQKTDPFSWMNDEFELAKREKEHAESATIAEERSLLLARLSLSAQKPASSNTEDKRATVVRRSSFVIERPPGDVPVPLVGVPTPIPSSSGDSPMVAARRQIGGSMSILPQKTIAATGVDASASTNKANAQRSLVTNVTAAPRSGLTPRTTSSASKPAPVRAVHSMVVGPDYDPGMTIFPGQPISNDLRRSLKLMAGFANAANDPYSNVAQDGEAQAYMVAGPVPSSVSPQKKEHVFVAPSSVAPGKRPGQGQPIAVTRSATFQNASQRGLAGSVANVRSSSTGTRLGPGANKVSNSMANLNLSARQPTTTQTRSTVRQSLVTSKQRPSTARAASVGPSAQPTGRPIPAAALNASRNSSSLARTQSQVQSNASRSSLNVRMNAQAISRPNSTRQQQPEPPTANVKRQAPVRATSTFNMTSQLQSQPQPAARRTGQPIANTSQRSSPMRNVAGGSMNVLTPANYNGVANVSPSRTHTVQNQGYVHVVQNGQRNMATPTTSANFLRPGTVTRQQGPSSLLAQGAVRSLSFDADDGVEGGCYEPMMDVNANRMPIPVNARPVNDAASNAKRSGIPLKGTLIPNMRPSAPVPQVHFQPIDAEDDFY